MPDHPTLVEEMARLKAKVPVRQNNPYNAGYIAACNDVEAILQRFLTRPDVVERAARAHWNHEADGDPDDMWDSGWNEEVLNREREATRAALASILGDADVNVR